MSQARETPMTLQAVFAMQKHNLLSEEAKRIEHDKKAREALRAARERLEGRVPSRSISQVVESMAPRADLAAELMPHPQERSPDHAAQQRSEGGFPAPPTGPVLGGA